MKDMSRQEERRGTRKLFLWGIVAALVLTLVVVFGPPLTRQLFPSGVGGSAGQGTPR
jgi:hypothetical protein